MSSAKQGGPVRPSTSVWRPLGPGEITITGGIWQHKQRVNADTTLGHCLTWMERVGWIGNFDRAAASRLSGPVAVRAQAMRHPERVHFHGATTEPRVALSNADIFFYPLQPDHYGTAENALIEAMSLGLVPVVLNNAAEMAIVHDGETGFVARSVEQATSLLQMLLSSPDVGQRIAKNAIEHVAETRTLDQSAREFMILWLGMLSKRPQHCDFRRAIGESPAEWFVATQGLPGASSRWSVAQQPAKGTLEHFESVFAGDASLTRLRQA